MVTGLKWDILGLGFKFRMLFSGQTFHCDTKHTEGATPVSVVLYGRQHSQSDLDKQL